MNFTDQQKKLLNVCASIIIQGRSSQIDLTDVRDLLDQYVEIGHYLAQEVSSMSEGRFGLWMADLFLFSPPLLSDRNILLARYDNPYPYYHSDTHLIPRPTSGMLLYTLTLEGGVQTSQLSEETKRRETATLNVEMLCDAWKSRVLEHSARVNHIKGCEVNRILSRSVTIEKISEACVLLGIPLNSIISEDI